MLVVTFFNVENTMYYRIWLKPVLFHKNFRQEEKVKDLKKKLEIAKKEKNETEIKSLEHSLEDLKVKVSKQHLTFAILLVICI